MQPDINFSHNKKTNINFYICIVNNGYCLEIEINKSSYYKKNKSFDTAGIYQWYKYFTTMTNYTNMPLTPASSIIPNKIVNYFKFNLLV